MCAWAWPQKLSETVTVTAALMTRRQEMQVDERTDINVETHVRFRLEWEPIQFLFTICTKRD